MFAAKCPSVKNLPPKPKKAPPFPFHFHKNVGILTLNGRASRKEGHFYHLGVCYAKRMAENDQVGTICGLHSDLHHSTID